MMNDIKSSNTRGVVQAAVKGTKWVFLSAFVSNTCQPFFAIILARVLVPSDFGLIAYATIFMGVVKLVQDVGLSQALIQRKEGIEKSADVIFTVNIVLGLIWYLGTFMVAPYLAEFFNDSRVTNILRIMALSFLIIPFGSVQNTLLTKHLHFSKLFFLGLVPALIPGLVSIVLAIVGYGVWSLVVGSLMGAVLNVLVTWVMIPWRPKWRFDLSLPGQMLKFGGAVSAESLLSWSVNTIDDVLVGKWLGGAALGLYTLGFRIGIAPAKYISSSLIRVAFPAFSMLQDNKDAIRVSFLKTVKFISLITFPLGIGIAVTASQFIPGLFGEKWINCVPVVQFIAIYGIFMSIGSILPPIYKALGRPDIYLKYASIRAAVAIPVYYCVIPYGLTALSAAHLILAIFFFPINLFVGMRVMRITLRMIFDCFWLAAIASFGVFLFAITLKEGLQYCLNLQSIWNLGIIVVNSILFYIVFLFVSSRQTFTEIKEIFFKILNN